MEHSAIYLKRDLIQDFDSFLFENYIFFLRMDGTEVTSLFKGKHYGILAVSIIPSLLKPHLEENVRESLRLKKVLFEVRRFQSHSKKLGYASFLSMTSK